eukprot:TRINITY_DN46371_c0_g2_i4.p1 TRINITY_DN46371_c0_g2~~TRINITY_DN46371_c0_g2_i4.p1  ORF type:complete len:367 (-),score=35.68 TRINITY_DN46371_c0_g2_i4:121-1221(-)
MVESDEDTSRRQANVFSQMQVLGSGQRPAGAKDADADKRLPALVSNGASRGPGEAEERDTARSARQPARKATAQAVQSLELPEDAGTHLRIAPSTSRPGTSGNSFGSGPSKPWLQQGSGATPGAMGGISSRPVGKRVTGSTTASRQGMRPRPGPQQDSRGEHPAASPLPDESRHDLDRDYMNSVGHRFERATFELPDERCSSVPLAMVPTPPIAPHGNERRSRSSTDDIDASPGVKGSHFPSKFGDLDSLLGPVPMRDTFTGEPIPVPGKPAGGAGGRGGGAAEEFTDESFVARRGSREAPVRSPACNQGSFNNRRRVPTTAAAMPGTAGKSPAAAVKATHASAAASSEKPSRRSSAATQMPSIQK